VKHKFLSVGSLALLQIIIVANLQPLSANAVYGFSLPFLYLLAAIGFFVPCIIMTSTLATSHPQTGGAYLWVEDAFGKKCGFFTVGLLWISNLLWYPSIFSLVASNAAYIIDPTIATHKLFITVFALVLFWLITFLNCLGVQISARLSIISALLGIILPMLLIIACGIYWWISGHLLAVSLKETPLIPDLRSLNNLGFIIAVAICFFGIEIPAVHAGNVINPKRDFPKSLWISGIAILFLTLAATLAISIIVPAAKLSVVTGLLDAIALFFHTFHMGMWLNLIFLLVFIGNLGSVTAWMLGSTRGMFIACNQNHVYSFLQKVNRHESPIGVLVFEAMLFTGAIGIFLIFPNIADAFWILLVVASQVTLVYYMILFASAIKLHKGSWKFIGLMLLGTLTSIASLIFGFIPPPDLTAAQITEFHMALVGGIMFSIALPLLLLLLSCKESIR